jgi:hypothetical protein
LGEVINDSTLNKAKMPNVNRTRCFFAVFCFSGSMFQDKKNPVIRQEAVSDQHFIAAVVLSTSN